MLDSGATGSFVTSSNQSALTNITATDAGFTIIAANGHSMPLHAEGRVRLSPALKSTSQYAFVLGDLKIGTVISLSQLCDNDCIALFMKYRVKIIMNIKVIITGQQDDNGLWSIPLAPAPPPLQANGILRLNKTKSELAAHHHAALGSPSTSTLL